MFSSTPRRLVAVFNSSAIPRSFAAAALFGSLCTSLISGCHSGEYYPVSGQIVDMQGQPIEGIEGAQVVFSLQNGLTSSVGDVQADGSFEMFTERPGDGVPPGEYRVLIARKYLDPERPAPQVIDARYENFDSSGLKAMVEPKSNVFEFKVERVRGRK
jgi:hypothetical protein